MISPYSGLVWTPEGDILLESMGSVLRLMTWSGACPDIIMRSSVSDSDVPVVPVADSGYYHFVAEVLPALSQAFQSCRTGRVIVRPGVPRYVRDGIALAVQARGASVQVETSTRPVRARSVVLVSMEPTSGFVRPADLAALFELRSDAPDSPEIVYVSRSKSPKRSFRNEALLEAAASSLGATVLHTEDLSLSEQIRELSGARLLIGMHGAGLVNMVWSRRLEQVLEVFPPGYRNDCFARLAVQMGSEYHFVLLTEADAEAKMDLACRTATSLIQKVGRSSTVH